MKTKITLFVSLIVVSMFIACSKDSGSGCAKVREAGFSITTPTRIDLQIDGDANSYQIDYGLTGFTQGSGTVFTTSDSYVEIVGLTPSTTYDFYIKSICSPTEMSSAYKVGSVTTDPSACTGNTTIMIYQITEDSIEIDLTYPGNAVEYQVQFGLQGFALGTGTTAISDDESIYLAGLIIGETYDFYARAKCIEGEWSPYKKYTFTND
jgi:hypothetical protein